MPERPRYGLVSVSRLAEMTHQASDQEMAEIGRLMLDLSDVKRDLDSARHRAEREAAALARIGELAVAGTAVKDDQRWPSTEECRKTRDEIASLEQRARGIRRELRNHSICSDVFELGVPV